jgi:hypothetical protein
VTNVTATLLNATQDVILDNLNVGSWGPGHPFTPTGTLGFPANDYPSNGTLGIDPTSAFTNLADRDFVATCDFFI